MTITATDALARTAVTSIAALTATNISSYAGGEHKRVMGYYAANDGGGDVFRYNASSSATANPGTIFAPNTGAGRWERTGNVKHLPVEAWGAGTGQSAATNRAALLAANSSAPDCTLYFTRGAYAIDNSSTFQFTSHKAGLIFENDSSLVFNTNTLSGITLQSCLPGLVLWNMRTAYATRPTARSASGWCPIQIFTCDSPYVYGTRISGSPGMGIIAVNCTRPFFKDTYIEDTWADGLHIRSCKSSFVDGLETYETGDDGFAVWNYTSAGADFGGGCRASKLRIRNSSSSGIAIGEYDTVISDFHIENTTWNGINISGNDAFTNRTPYDVKIHHGRIANTGTYARTGGHVPATGEGIGIRAYVAAGSPAAKNIVFDDIEIENTKYRVVDTNLASGDITFNRIKAKGGTNNTTDNTGGSFEVTAPKVNITNCSVQDITGRPYTIYDCDYVYLRNLVASNFGANDVINAASYMAAVTKSMAVDAENIYISDDRGTILGWTMWNEAASTFTLSGNLGTVRYRFTQAALSGAQNPFVVTGAGTVNLQARRVYQQGTQKSIQSAAPSSGYWTVGDIVFNSAPGAGLPVGWACSASGAPGTFVPFGFAQGQSAAQTISAVGNTILANASYVRVTDSSGHILSSTPTIADGVDGQIVTITSVGSSAVTLQDQGSLAGTNLRLGSASRALGTRDSITLMFSSDVGDWLEQTFSNVI